MKVTGRGNVNKRGKYGYQNALKHTEEEEERSGKLENETKSKKSAKEAKILGYRILLFWIRLKSVPLPGMTCERIGDGREEMGRDEKIVGENDR